MLWEERCKEGGFSTEGDPLRLPGNLEISLASLKIVFSNNVLIS